MTETILNVTIDTGKHEETVAALDKLVTAGVLYRRETHWRRSTGDVQEVSYGPSSVSSGFYERNLVEILNGAITFPARTKQYRGLARELQAAIESHASNCDAVIAAAKQ